MTTYESDDSNDRTIDDVEDDNGQKNAVGVNHCNQQPQQPQQPQPPQRQEEQSSCDYIVMSEAGKPIFTTLDENTHDLAKICGLVQAIRTSLTDPSAGLGDIRSLQTRRRRIVVMVEGSITLVAVSSIDNTEAFLRVMLEYIYSQIIFIFTQQIQAVYWQDPGYDLRDTMGGSEAGIRAIIKEAQSNLGHILLGSVEMVCPIPSEMREKASRVLQKACKATDNTVFAFLLVDGQLFTLVQPRYIPHQLKPSDLRLLISFVSAQPGLLTSELWFPVCLPRFNSTGFLYTYTTCLDEETGLSLGLISQLNTTDQFELFRTTSRIIRRDLGLPSIVGTVLRIVGSGSDDDDGNDDNDDDKGTVDDVRWKRCSDTTASDTERQQQQRHHQEETKHGDEGRDGIDGGVEIGAGGAYSTPRRRRHSITIPDDGEPSPSCPITIPLLKELTNALRPDKVQRLVEKYIEALGVIHFLFRFDAKIPNKSSIDPNGAVLQSFCPPIGPPFLDEASKNRVLGMYHRLQLRIKIGSATTEVILSAVNSSSAAGDEKTHTDAQDTAMLSSLEHCCQAMGLIERKVGEYGLTYVADDQRLFVAMIGRNFEL